MRNNEICDFSEFLQNLFLLRKSCHIRKKKDNVLPWQFVERYFFPWPRLELPEAWKGNINRSKSTMEHGKINVQNSRMFHHDCFFLVLSVGFDLGLSFSISNAITRSALQSVLRGIGRMKYWIVMIVFIVIQDNCRSREKPCTSSWRSLSLFRDGDFRCSNKVVVPQLSPWYLSSISSLSVVYSKFSQWG